MSVRIMKRGSVLYLDTRWNGKREKKSLKLRLTKDKKQNEEILRIAEAIRVKEELRLISEKHGFTDPVAGKQSILEYAKIVSKGRSSGDHLSRVVAYIKNYQGGTALNSIGIRYVEGFKTYLSGTGLSPQSQRHMYNALKRILDQAIREGIIERNPAKLLRSPSVPEKPPVFLDLSELETLSSIPLQGDLGQEVQKAFLFACYTGLRISDLKSLRWADINQEKSLILKAQKKTGRIVSVNIHPTAWKMIDPGDRIHRSTEPVFPKLATTHTTTNKILQQWAYRAGISKNIGWHTARKTFATQLLHYSGDYSATSKLLGHSDVKITQRYAEVLSSEKERAIRSIPELKIEQFKSGRT